MGSANIGGTTLNSVVDVSRKTRKTVVDHMIPGAPAIEQANGRPRDLVTITGILNPTSEITAVQNIAFTLGANTTPFTVTAVTDVQGTDWAGVNGNTYFLRSVSTKTEKGATVPWGTYQLEIVEVGP